LFYFGETFSNIGFQVAFRFPRPCWVNINIVDYLGNWRFSRTFIFSGLIICKTIAILLDVHGLIEVHSRFVQARTRHIIAHSDVLKRSAQPRRWSCFNLVFSEKGRNNLPLVLFCYTDHLAANWTEIVREKWLNPVHVAVTISVRRLSVETRSELNLTLCLYRLESLTRLPETA
jgi:hypothetical protein